MVGPPLRDATLRCWDGKVVAIMESSQDPAWDLGEVAIVPSFVNAHVHFELCDRRCPLPFNVGSTFADWLRSVLEHRQERDGSPDHLGASLQKGLREASQFGTGAYCDIVLAQCESAFVADEYIGAIACREGLGLSRERGLAVQESWCDFLEGVQPKESSGWSDRSGGATGGDYSERFLRGLSPHAPYSTSWQLVEKSVELSRRYGCLLAMHVAETTEEIELLAKHSGPLREFLEERKIWPVDPQEVLHASTAPYLEVLAGAERALIIHGNYLTSSELDILARHRQRMALVHCPRTHQYFGREAFDLSGHLKRGVRVAIGTDSGASNPDVSMFGELQSMVVKYPQVSPEQLWGLVTRDGAHALGLERMAGALIPGMPANFVAIELDSSHGSTPWEQSIGNESKLAGVWQWGRRTA